MKGILLAGGKGSRLYPLTKGMPKSLVPVYNKPMAYYSLSTLMLAGIKDILVITNPEFIDLFKNIFGDGSSLGLRISYKEQPTPRGIAEAFIIGEDFIGKDSVCLMLGDNIFYGHDLPLVLQRGKENIIEHGGAVIFGYNVSNPKDYGVVEQDISGNIKSIEEKPASPKSSIAVVGLYMYDNSIISISKKIRPSTRGELEITTVNQEYLATQKIKLEMFGRGYAWFDTGNCDSLFEASSFVQAIEKRQGLKIACLEEIAYNMNFINAEQLLASSRELSTSEYGRYLATLITNRDHPEGEQRCH